MIKYSDISKKILFVGDLNCGTRSLMRLDTLRDLSSSIIAISNTKIPFLGGIDKPSLLSRLFFKMGYPLDESKLNKTFLNIIKTHNDIDLIWIEKSLFLKPYLVKLAKTLHPKTKIISITEDDMYALHNRSKFYNSSLPYYDHIFTTKEFNVLELPSIGAKQVHHFNDSFYEKLHKPLVDYSCINSKDIDVSFIGTYEIERAEIINWLANKGITIHVYGSQWNKFKDKLSDNLKIYPPVYSDNYVDIINRSKINLCFLRKINRDTITSRSIEIPACAGFMIAERTKDHMDKFIEGKECEFFSSKMELYEKIIYYLSNLNMIYEIGQNARQKCVNQEYGMSNELIKILNIIFKN